MKKILQHLFENKNFTRSEAKEILVSIGQGAYEPAQIASFIAAYCMRNITVDELQGFRDAMLELCIRVDLSDYQLIDLCGTGGDGKDTFNISTLASFVVAGAGHKVAKHGNYGVSSGCGSSNVMESVGYRFTNNPDQLKRDLDNAGICFLHAPLFNPAMKTVAPIRKAMGVKTFFNMLGPMVNPAQPSFQVTGVFSLELARLYAYLYQETAMQYQIVHALDGFDEISLTSLVKLYGNSGESTLNLFEMGFKKLRVHEIQGGTNVESSGKIFLNVLQGSGTEAQNNVVLCNAALAIQTIMPNQNFMDCFDMAKDSLVSKKALRSFKALVAQ